MQTAMLQLRRYKQCIALYDKIVTNLTTLETAQHKVTATLTALRSVTACAAVFSLYDCVAVS
jgi:hypothetical protein